MDKTQVKSGQSWWDVGVELAGAWEAGIDLALALGVSMTEAPPLLSLSTQASYNKPMQRYCHAEGVSPATLYDETGVRWQIFAEPFNKIYR